MCSCNYEHSEYIQCGLVEHKCANLEITGTNSLLQSVDENEKRSAKAYSNRPENPSSQFKVGIYRHFAKFKNANAMETRSKAANHKAHKTKRMSMYVDAGLTKNRLKSQKHLT